MALWPAPHMALFSIVNQTILTEIGTDLSRFPTEKHFASWLGLAPHHEISGGKLLRNGTLKGNHRAAQTFRQTAQSVARSHSALGAYYRRQRARLTRSRALSTIYSNTAKRLSPKAPPTRKPTSNSANSRNSNAKPPNLDCRSCQWLRLFSNIKEAGG